MPGAIEDINRAVGSYFGNWCLLSYAGDHGAKNRKFAWVLCKCGTVSRVCWRSIHIGKSKSCGCEKVNTLRQKSTKHGMSRSTEYSTWKGMMNRCSKNGKSSNTSLNARYRDRGVYVCDQWEDFQEFYNYMGPKPAGMSIDRIDNNRGYEPGNVRWATPKEQARNRASNRTITAFGTTACISEWAEKTGLSESAIKGRLNYGYPPEVALGPIKNAR